jgi:hypothetical protein
LNEFKNLISNFKPKQSVLEMGIVKSNDQDRIAKFKENIQVQEVSKKLKMERQDISKQMKELLDSAQHEED